MGSILFVENPTNSPKFELLISFKNMNLDSLVGDAERRPQGDPPTKLYLA
jgi:hypothetical protein